MKYCLFGAGGFAREVSWLLQENKCEVHAFIDDNPDNYSKVINNVQVVSYEQAKVNLELINVVVCIGQPQVRKRVSKRLIEDGFTLTGCISNYARISQYNDIAKTAVVCAGSIITTNVVINNGVHINLNCSIGHDAVIDDYVTIAPGVNISGNVLIEENCYIGTGASIINGSSDNPLIIGANSVIAAGACVTKSLPPNHLYAGVPAVVKKELFWPE